jgi:hypothetical protein
MYHITGLTRDEIVDVCARLHASGLRAGRDGYPPILGLYRSVKVALTYARRNSVQWELAEYYEVSQSTISRAVCVITPALAEVLRPFVPTADELPPDEVLIFDGTLVPCWSWKDHPELYSGKHRETGLNLQVACDMYLELRWISDPVDGRHHDMEALRVSNVLDMVDPGNWLGDKAYVGAGMVTPIKKKPHQKHRLDWEREFNTTINKIRWRIEQVIANLKTWRILQTDYRRPLDTFRETISAVVGLHFYRMS